MACWSSTSLLASVSRRTGVSGFGAWDDAGTGESVAPASRGKLSLWGVGVAGALGGIVGGSAGYLIGAQGGLRLIRRYGAKMHVDEARLLRARKFFERRGLWAAFLCRFVGFLRIVVP